jgi:hypothetical protein
VIPGSVPDIYRLPVGCKFVTRCPYAFEPCPDIEPPLIEDAPGHWVRCHLYPNGGKPAVGREPAAVGSHRVPVAPSIDDTLADQAND